MYNARTRFILKAHEHTILTKTKIEARQRFSTTRMFLYKENNIPYGDTLPALINRALFLNGIRFERYIFKPVQINYFSYLAKIDSSVLIYHISKIPPTIFIL